MHIKSSASRNLCKMRIQNFNGSQCNHDSIRVQNLIFFSFHRGLGFKQLKQRYCGPSLYFKVTNVYT